MILLGDVHGVQSEGTLKLGSSLHWGLQEGTGKEKLQHLVQQTQPRRCKGRRGGSFF